MAAMKRRSSWVSFLLLLVAVGRMSTAHAGPCLGDGVACFADRLFVGWDRDAERQLSGGVFEFSDIVIGLQFDGALEVDGQSVVSANSVVVGVLGDGVLSLSDDVSLEVGRGEGEVLLGIASSGKINMGAAGGHAAIGPGVLRASRIYLGPGGGEIVFNHTADAYDFDVDVIGSSGTLLLEAGQTRLTGDLSRFFGRLIVDSGKHNGAAALAFSGGGQAGQILTLGGDFSLREGGALRIKVDSEGRADRLDVGGTVNLAGDLEIRPVGELADYGAPKIKYRYPVITYASDRREKFARAYIVNNEFLEVEKISYEDEGRVVVTLTLNRPDLSEGAITANTKEVAKAIEGLDYSLPGGAAVFEGLRALSDEDHFDALTQIGGFGLASVFRQPEILARPFVETLFSRMSSGTSRRGPDNVFVSTSSPKGLRLAPDKNVWGMAFGGHIAREGDLDTPSIDAGTAGFLVGTDVNLEMGGSIGAALGFSRTNSAAGTVVGEAQGYHLGLYGAAGADSALDVGLGIRGALFASSFAFGTERTITFGNWSNAAEANFAGRGAGVKAIIRYGFGDDQKSRVIAPFAGLHYAHFQSDGYSETGAPLLGLDASLYRSDRLRSVLGVEWAGVKKSRIGEVQHKMAILWEHALISSVEERRFRLGGSSFPMNFSDRGYDRDRISLSAGLTFDLSERAVLELSGAADFAKDEVGFKGSISYQFRF